jgi:hypothetical protein
LEKVQAKKDIVAIHTAITQLITDVLASMKILNFPHLDKRPIELA